MSTAPDTEPRDTEAVDPLDQALAVAHDLAEALLSLAVEDPEGRDQAWRALDRYQELREGMR